MSKNLDNKVLIILISLFSLFYFQTVLAVDTDTDSDTISDEIDNCTEISNIEQRDSDGDGFGNRCDADFNNDCIVTLSDFTILSDYMGQSNINIDLNDDGLVDSLDFIIFRKLLGLPVGPSGIATCG